MKRLILLFLAVTFSNILLAQHYNPKYGYPIVVLTIADPWAMVIGSDVPSFAVYQNGQIIYRKIINKHAKYFEVDQTQDEVQKTLENVGITDSLFKLPKDIIASRSTDQPGNELILNFNSIKVITVYGYLNNEKSEARLKTPKPFLSVYDHLVNFNDARAKAWMPDTVEVMLTGYSYAPEKSMKWPKNWPDLKSTSTVKRDSDFYSIYLDKKYFDDFVKLISSLKEKQAVEINGQKFSISYRLPFPNIK